MTQLTRRRALTLLGGTALTLTMRPLRAQSPRPLIVYLTRTGNTRALAEIIAAETGGELFALTPQPPYSRDYEENVA